ncbi:CHD3-type chromatin-remodeling factor PICKLE [Monoraphidium neglectum]|uniref:CHD3-type chromatin-remodeling factor PICKLE n=1 Tax=Monoraphidium neglectum TaxID=145388 RepID=A0A0D2IWS4_9CHLO|nr:CHD3-type chromatin-remodeling factor PICKLE [Monoraphidium neglectum]KIY92437.1 CHD3-type chromatin-remodeling factor PICKLE [Monoraphidium neglectum]|eukprot:XP_013891457.1 CHD3-type chromatin-remodeling factor PICKLE [Monoraphidium neglectum]
MHFLDPEKFADPEMVAQEFHDLNHQEQVSELHSRLKPHLLRRVKKDVLKQLPPKMEQIVRVELSAKQREWYKMILTKNFGALATLGGKGNAGAMKLRNLAWSVASLGGGETPGSFIEWGNLS